MRDRIAISVLVALCGAACSRTPVYWRDEAAEGVGGRWPAGEVDEAEPAQTCQAVDFLFVIDNSGSMVDDQAKLAANVDGLIGGIRATVEAVESVHVGVITTDSYEPNVEGCQALGGLVVRTGGADSSEARCGPYAEGHAYMTEADDLEAAFRCAARVGSSGDASEAVLSAPIAALSPPLTDPGACNEGFLREDALLVLVVLTDTDAEVDPVQAFLELVDRKPNGQDDVVAVVLANPVGGECSDYAESSFWLDSFVTMFRYGFMGAVCADDYDEAFADAVEVVASACPQRD